MFAHRPLRASRPPLTRRGTPRQRSLPTENSPGVLIAIANSGPQFRQREISQHEAAEMFRVLQVLGLKIRQCQFSVVDRRILDSHVTTARVAALSNASSSSGPHRDPPGDCQHHHHADDSQRPPPPAIVRSEVVHARSQSPSIAQRSIRLPSPTIIRRLHHGHQGESTHETPRLNPSVK